MIDPENFDHRELHERIRSIDPRVYLIRVELREDRVWVGVNYQKHDEAMLEITPERQRARAESLRQVLAPHYEHPVEVEIDHST